MSDVVWAVVEAFNWVVLTYFILLNGVYLGTSLFAFRALRRYALRLRSLDLTDLITSAGAPPISLIAPAYNEAVTCVDSVRSLLSLEYPDYEVIVVNDGSSDDTVDVLREAFEFEPASRIPTAGLPTAAVRATYRSRTHPSLWLVDKDNGGKADALNAGLNHCYTPIFCAMDADSILEPQALIRIIRPFLEDASTVAAGGILRIANGCTVEHGRVTDVRLPRSLLAQFQVLEYLRVFLAGRMGWAAMDATLIISGAFGIFRRSSVVDAGGYATDTVGEDMELIVRLHRRGLEAGTPHRIHFVPDPVAWTECPESLRVLARQRDRWQRGLPVPPEAQEDASEHQVRAGGHDRLPVLLLPRDAGPAHRGAGVRVLHRHHPRRPGRLVSRGGVPVGGHRAGRRSFAVRRRAGRALLPALPPVLRPLEAVRLGRAGEPGLPADQHVVAGEGHDFCDPRSRELGEDDPQGLRGPQAGDRSLTELSYWLPEPTIALRCGLAGLVVGVAAAGLASLLRARGVRVAYTRKIFHFAVFTGAAWVHTSWGLPGTNVYGGVVALMVLAAVWASDGNPLYEALARDSDRPHRSLFVVVPLVMTAVGGLASALIAGPYAGVGYLVAGWGDAVGEPVGSRWGKHRYSVPSLGGVPAQRSLEGSAAVFLAGWLAASAGLAAVGAGEGFVWVGLACAAAGALAEAVSNHGLDNLTVQIVASVTAWALLT